MWTVALSSTGESNNQLVCRESLPRLLGASDSPQVIPTRSKAVAYQPIRKMKRERLSKCGEDRYIRTLLPPGGTLPPGCWKYPAESSGLGRHTAEGRRVDTYRCSIVSVSPRQSGVVTIFTLLDRAVLC